MGILLGILVGYIIIAIIWIVSAGENIEDSMFFDELNLFNYLKENTDMNSFGCAFCSVGIIIINPIPSIIAEIYKFFYWLFHLDFEEKRKEKEERKIIRISKKEIIKEIKKYLNDKYKYSTLTVLSVEDFVKILDDFSNDKEQNR